MLLHGVNCDYFKRKAQKKERGCKICSRAILEGPKKRGQGSGVKRVLLADEIYSFKDLTSAGPGPQDPTV